MKPFCQHKTLLPLLIFLAVSLLSVSVFADETQAKNADDASQPAVKKTPEKSPWAGSNVQFGFVMNTGNTDAKNLNGALVLDYTKGKWQNTTNIAGQYNTGRTGTDKEVFSFKNQGEYKFRPKDYVFLKVDSTFDRFSPYNYVVLEALGLGRVIYESEKFKIVLQAGPGGRHVRVRSSKRIRNDVILDSDARFVWNITDKATFKETLNADFGSPYNYYQSDTSLTTQLIGQLGVQIAFSVQHYTRIPPGSKNTFKTDTTTTIGLVYTL